MRVLMGLVCICSLVGAEEGMWPFNMLPVEKVEKDYGVKLTEEWREHVQRACVRINLGGSGSFVSAKGLIMTNHHVGSKAIYNLSTKDADLMERGFLAKKQEEELKCPNMYVESLVSIQDVTDVINGDMTEAMSGVEKEKIRKQKIAQIAKEAQNKTGLQPEVITLYQGARHHLYLYKRFTDVRLVMAPEKNIAFFGGDKDNFEYPRYNLDVCFFRAYENDQPVSCEHYLRWSSARLKEHQPLFVAGHPGKTERMLTSDQVRFFEEKDLPMILALLSQKITALKTFGEKSAENARIAEDLLFSCQNAFKVYSGLALALQESAVIEKKEEKERELYGDPTSSQYESWKRLRVALEEFKEYHTEYMLLEGVASNYSKLYTWAKHLVRLERERNKPSGERLKEYADHQLAALELTILSTEPLYKNLEQVLLEGSLQRLVTYLGPHHPVVKSALEGKVPAQRAEEMLQGVELTDVSVRAQLFHHPEEIYHSSDPFIKLALALDPYARDRRQKKEDGVESVQKESYAAIAALLFSVYGETVYPDATFTLRLSIGSLKGYEEKGSFVKPITTLGEIFTYAKLHQCKMPYQLPHSWKGRGSLLKKNAPFNFVSTNDIIGGNSGSPILNAEGEVVGLIFDGNIHSLIWNYAFEDKQGRAISVHTQGIMEALRKIYQADRLVKEIQESGSKQAHGVTARVL